MLESNKSANSDPAALRAELKSLIRKNLLASPYFSRLYADVIQSERPNSRLAKILAKRNKKNSMPSQVKSCTHIKVTGIRCGSPALRGEQFCYFHQRMVRGVRLPSESRIHPLALIESPESIQASLMEVLNAIARNNIDLKRATLLLRGLSIAAKNASRARFDLFHSEMVNQVPDYDANAGPTPSSANHAGRSGHTATPAASQDRVEAAYQIPYSDEVMAQQWQLEREARQRFLAQNPRPAVQTAPPTRKPPTGAEDSRKEDDGDRKQAATASHA